jgi:tripartite-type tricarboxylate transporter receptor subunit TctC
MDSKRIKLFLIFASCCLVITSLSFAAEKYPTRPIELYLPFGPGGQHDMVSMILTSKAYQYLGQPLVIVMKPGAGGIVGTAFVARAKPDGYTLLLGATGPSTIACHVEEKVGYSKDDFVSVAQISQTPFLVVIGANKPWKTLKDLLNHISKDPKKVVFGTMAIHGVSGLGNVMLLDSAQIKTLPASVPFKSGSELNIATMKGDIDYFVNTVSATIPFLRSKELRALAVLDVERDPLLPDIPTAKELGYDVVVKQWLSILAPKGTPAEVIETLSKGFGKIANDPSFVQLMTKSEIPVTYKNGEEFQRYWDEEYKKYAEIVKKLNLKKK